MFEDLPRNAENLLYCKNVIEDGNKKIYILIQKFKEDYEFKQINDNLNLIKDTRNTLNNNRFKSIIIYYNKIKDTIERIETKTEDKELLNDLEEFKNYKIDLKKSHNENISDVIKKLEEVLKYEAKIDYVLEPNKTKKLVG